MIDVWLQILNLHLAFQWQEKCQYSLQRKNDETTIQ